MSVKRKGILINSKAYLPMIFAVLFLLFFGSIMIISASMPYATGETDILISTGIRQLLYCIVALIPFFFLMNFDILRLNIFFYYVAYFIILALLLITRLFGALGGAYGWINLGPVTIQPSEFAKVFIIIFGAKLLGKDKGENNINNFYKFLVFAFIYFIVIALYQKDFGSGAVLLVISYCILLIPPYKQLKAQHRLMVLLMILVVLLALFILSPIGTNILTKMASSNYMIARFLSSANPFNYLYDDGYHLVMSLISFASGGLFGLGYGNSIHKYMNFPNPTSDFILPVIIEELGIVFGLLPILISYYFILKPIINYSIKTKSTASKMVFLGTFMYFTAHFIFNVGGVSGLIPLTGVPLLLLSSGGTSLIACLASLGIVEKEIIKTEKQNESDSGNI